MASDMVVALARATRDGHTLFAHNSNRPHGEAPSLVRTRGRDHTPGEMVRTTHLSLPQARRTFTVLAGRTNTDWGYQHGMNDKGVVAAWTPIRTRLLNDSPCLTGSDLVRLALERSTTALHAVEVLTDLIGRYGQGAFLGGGEDRPDAAVLVADPKEAHVLEAAGRHWALATIGSVRAVSAACFLRQDWDRISRGLSDLAIQRGWWPEDGCKLDFAGVVSRPADLTQTLRRWGAATMQLEQHSGSIHGALLRQLLREQSEALAPADPGDQPPIETSSSLIVRLGRTPEHLSLAWCAFGAPPNSVYVPLVLASEIPSAYQDSDGRGSVLWRLLSEWARNSRRDASFRAALHSGLARLQQQLDTWTLEIMPDADSLYQRGEHEELRRLAGSFMQRCAEAFADLADSLGGRQRERASSENAAEVVLP